MTRSRISLGTSSDTSISATAQQQASWWPHASSSTLDAWTGYHVAGQDRRWFLNPSQRRSTDVAPPSEASASGHVLPRSTSPVALGTAGAVVQIEIRPFLRALTPNWNCATSRLIELGQFQLGASARRLELKASSG